MYWGIKMKKLFVFLVFLLLPLFLFSCGGNGTFNKDSEAFKALMEEIGDNDIEVISVKWISIQAKHEKEKFEGIHYYIVYKKSTGDEEFYASIEISKATGVDEEIIVDTDYSDLEDLNDDYDIDVSMQELAVAFAKEENVEYSFKEGTLSASQISSALKKAKK